MVELLHVAHRFDRPRRLGEGGFEGEDRRRLLLRFGGRQPREHQHLGDVLHVGGAQGLLVGGGREIVVALRQAEAALGEVRHDGIRVLQVGEDLGVEERRGLQALDLAREHEQVVAVAGGVDLRQPGLDGSEPGALDRRLVHAGAVEVTDLLALGVAGRVLGGIFDQPLQELAVALVDHREGAHPLALVGRQLDLVEPAAAGEAIEVGARVGRPVERARDRDGDVFDIEVGSGRGIAGHLGGGGGERGGEKGGRQQDENRAHGNLLAAFYAGEAPGFCRPKGEGRAQIAPATPPLGPLIPAAG